MIEHLIRFDTIQIIAFCLSAVVVIHLILAGPWLESLRSWREIIPRIESFLARHESVIAFAVVAIITAILWLTYAPPFKA